MLFQFIDKALDCVIDTINYGPLEAARINTSFCPQAERDYREVNAKVQKAIDEAFEKFEESADADEDEEEPPECGEKEALTAEEFAEEMIGEIGNFMDGWMSNLYKNSRATEEDTKEVMEETDAL